MITGIDTLSAIQPAIVTHSVIVAVPTSARPVYAPTTPPVPTNNASQPAFSMIRACAAVGGCKTARTLSRRWIRSRRCFDFDSGFLLMCLSLEMSQRNDRMGYVAVNIAVEEHWHNLLRAMGREDLRDDPRFADNAARVANREATDALVAAWTRTLGKMEVFA